MNRLLSCFLGKPMVRMVINGNYIKDLKLIVFVEQDDIKQPANQDPIVLIAVFHLQFSIELFIYLII